MDHNEHMADQNQPFQPTFPAVEEHRRSKLLWLLPVIVLVIVAGYLLYANRTRFQRQDVRAVPSGTKSDMLVRVIGVVKETSRDGFSLQSGNTTYEVQKTDKVAIIRRAMEIPYVFNTRTSETVQKALMSDIDTGMSLEVSGTTDSHNVLNATLIMLPRITFVLEGTIQEKRAGSFTMDAVPVMETPKLSSDGQPIPPTHSIYTIHLTTDTEISRDTDGTPTRYTLSDLELGSRVVVYANKDVTKSRDITAARVEPVLK